MGAVKPLHTKDPGQSSNASSILQNLQPVPRRASLSSLLSSPLLTACLPHLWAPQCWEEMPHSCSTCDSLHTKLLLFLPSLYLPLLQLFQWCNLCYN